MPPTDKRSNRLSQLNLSLDEVRHLLGIAVSALGSFRHDLTSKLSVPVTILTTMERDAFWDWTRDEQKDLIALAKKNAIHAGEICETGLSFTRIIRDFDPFVTDVLGVISKIQNLHDDVIFDVTPETTNEHINLIYPESAFFLIINGLIENSEKHGIDKPKVRLTFRTHGNKFICVVEDNGPGISGTVSGSYLPWDQIHHFLGRREDSSALGLSAIYTIICASEGLLLFGRSNSLGGTEVLIELPVLGFWDNNQIERFRTVS